MKFPSMRTTRATMRQLGVDLVVPAVHQPSVLLFEVNLEFTICLNVPTLL